MLPCACLPAETTLQDELTCLCVASTRDCSLASASTCPAAWQLVWLSHRQEHDSTLALVLTEIVLGVPGSPCTPIWCMHVTHLYKLCHQLRPAAAHRSFSQPQAPRVWCQAGVFWAGRSVQYLVAGRKARASGCTRCMDVLLPWFESVAVCCAGICYVLMRAFLHERCAV